MLSLRDRIPILFFCAVALLWGNRALAEQGAEQLAIESAERWLALTDAGKYADSYHDASQYFKAAVSSDQWQTSMHAVRDPLGKLVSRKLKGSRYTETLPGAPDGKYVVLQCDTGFEYKRSAVETITPMLDNDGKWRVSGYFIK